MADKKKIDEAYLNMSAMIRSREARMLSADRMERMLSAGSFQEAAKLLCDCGYEDVSGMDAAGVDEALQRRREAVFTELRATAPQPELIDAFCLKYDYHNIKVLVKAEAAGTDGAYLISRSGMVSPQRLTDAYREEDYRFLPPYLGPAMAEAKAVLSRTMNPQTADFGLDAAYFAHLGKLAEAVDNVFFTGYVRTLIDSANLRTAVRTVRMGKNQDFLMTALVPGGSVGCERIAQATFSGADALATLFGGCLGRAAELGVEAMRGGPMTAFERACDNGVSAYLSAAKLKPFGPEAVAEYMALLEGEITAARMILTGRLAGISPDTIRERLRDVNA